MNDLISRQAAIDIASGYCHPANIAKELAKLPSAQPEITDEQAIEHLQSTGWMQNHDREMYESGLREQLADDSGSYDSLLPSAQPEIIRCKDCKHYGESLPDVDTRMICHKTALNYKPDDFCSYAERRTDDIR